MRGWWSDLRLAMKALRRSPGFSSVVVLTLALGIGLNVAVFSVVDGVVLRPLEYPGADRLVYLQSHRRTEGTDDALVSGGDWRAFQEGTPGLESLEALATVRQTLAGAGLPRQVQVGWVSSGFLGMLGVEPVVGRVIAPSDPPGTVVVSHALWLNHLGGDPAIRGRTVRLDGHAYTIVGVMPPGFRLDLPVRGGRLPEIEIWKNPDALWQNGDFWSQQGLAFGMLRMVGLRLPGVSIETVQAQADATVASLWDADAQYEATDFGVTVHDLRQRLVSDVRPMLLLLMSAVAFVLLIAAANVANLLLVRAHGRRREVAVRVAIGANRARVARYLLAESLILAVGGAAVGLGLAAAFVALMPLLGPQDIPRLGQVGLDGRAAAFALVVALGTTVLVGFAPAWSATKTDPSSTLGNARSVGGGGSRARDALVVAQVALSLVLMVGAGLLVSSLSRLGRVDPGFEPDGLYTFAVSIPGTDYGWPAEAGAYYREVQERVSSLPGVSAAGVVWPMPFSGSWSGDYRVAGSGQSTGLVPYYLATEEYFAAAEIPLVAGRLFRDADAPDVAVISETAARRAFPDGSALGRVVSANPWGGAPTDYEVIGVVGDVRHAALSEPSEGGLYFDARTWSWVDWEVHVVARTDEEAGTLVPALRQAVAEIDGEVPLARPQAMSEVMASGTATARFLLALLAVFAAAAAFLAVVGLYGVVSYSVGLRSRELGIRLALGSERAGIQRLVVGRGLVVATLGVVVGGIGSLAFGRLLQRYLFEVAAGDPLTLVAAASLLALATLVASWIPARRAAGTDPVVVLRQE